MHESHSHCNPEGRRCEALLVEGLGPTYFSREVQFGNESEEAQGMNENQTVNMGKGY